MGWWVGGLVDWWIGGWWLVVGGWWLVVGWLVRDRPVFEERHKSKSVVTKTVPTLRAFLCLDAAREHTL